MQRTASCALLEISTSPSELRRVLGKLGLLLEANHPCSAALGSPAHLGNGLRRAGTDPGGVGGREAGLTNYVSVGRSSLRLIRQKRRL